LGAIEASVTINRPAGEVFAFLADFENEPEWNSFTVDAAKLTPGLVGVGTRYRTVGRVMGAKKESETEVTAYEPDTYVAWRSVSGLSWVRAPATPASRWGEAGRA
jgi:uncharacterized membrane protein